LLRLELRVPVKISFMKTAGRRMARIAPKPEVVDELQRNDQIDREVPEHR